MPLKKQRFAITNEAADISKKSFADAGFEVAADAPTAYVYALPVLPPSPAIPTDGREPLVYDAQALIDTFRTAGRKLPLDLNHDTEFGGGASGGVALGWLIDLFVAESGVLYAWVELNAEGIEAIEGKRFGYTSPTVIVGKGNRVVKLKSLALTNNPALEMPATFSAQDADDEDTEGVSVEATEQAPEAAAAAAETPAEVSTDTQPLSAATEGTSAAADAATDEPQAEQTAAPAAEAAVTQEQPQAEAVATAEPAAEVFEAEPTTQQQSLASHADTDSFAATARGIEQQIVALGFTYSAEAIVAAFQRAALVEGLQAQVEQAQASFAAVTADFAAYKTAAFEADVKAAVDAAIAGGKFTPAQRGFLETAARNDLNGFRSFVADTKASAATASFSTQNNESESFGLTPEQLQICQRTGVKPETYAKAIRDNS